MGQQLDGRGRGRIGPWRLFDLAHATMSFRGAFFGGVALLPEHGLPDAPVPNVDPARELPNSNIGDGEQQQAMQRERSRRFMRARRTGA